MTIKWTINEADVSQKHVKKYFGNLYTDNFIKWDDCFNKFIKEEKQMEMAVDVTEELKDLLSKYIDDEKSLLDVENAALNMMTNYMKRYISIQEKRMKISSKLVNLKQKIACGEPDKDDGNCDEEE